MLKRPYDRQDYLVLFIFSGVLGLAAKFIRRINHVECDLARILLGSFPSFFAVIGIAFLSLAYTKVKHQKAIFFCFLGSLIYEFEQVWSSRVFDIYDIIALLLGYLFALTIYNYGKPNISNTLELETSSSIDYLEK